MWQLISDNNVQAIQQVLQIDKSLANVRSADGRGPLWWAYENKNHEIIAVLKRFGAKENERDGAGKLPREMAE